ncbi:MAG: hypothetical protein IKA06_03260 [Clostridia bacterium]|nr:hypothetical protein [Clostridia bacterium]
MTRTGRKRTVLFCLALPVLLLFLALPVGAEGEGGAVSAESAEIKEEWEAFRAAIPPEVQDLLPKDFFSEDMTVVAQGVGEASSLTAIFRAVGRVTGLAIVENLALLAKMCGILVLSATFRAAVGERKNEMQGAISLITVLAITLMLFAGEETKFSQMERFFDTVRTLCLALIPLMGALYAMGGNVAAAVANHGVMSGFLAILETACSGVVVPVACVLVALALLDAVTGKGSLGSLSNLLKRTFTFGLSFFMMLLIFVLGIQHTLAKGSDTLALRTVRFAAGSFLPVVGGSISETLRTVAGSVEYLRGAVGVGGILVIFFLFLPTFLSVLLTRIAFSLSSAVAGLLSCAREQKLLGEISSVWGYFLSVIACLFVMTVFSLTLFAHSAAAIGA